MTVTTDLTLLGAEGTTRERGERTLTTEWMVGSGEGKDGKPYEVVLALNTHHYKDRKVFRSTLGYFVREQNEFTREDGSVYRYGVEKYMLFTQAQATLGLVEVSRYSVKRRNEAHAQALASLAASLETATVQAVLAEAQAKGGDGK